MTNTNVSDKKQKTVNYIVGIVCLVVLIALDQWTKKIAIDRLMNKEPFILINNVFQLHYLENRGAAFGILQNQKWFFVIIGIFILVGIAYIYSKMPISKKYTLLRVLAVLMAAGAIGNMIDRVVNNYVVDFIYFELINFPIFNVADCYVTIAAALLIISIIFIYKDDDLKFLSGKSDVASGDEDDKK